MIKDSGFNGQGNLFSPRFGANESIYASQLNALASGLQIGLVMPYLGAGPTIAYTSSGTVITNGADPVKLNGDRYLNQFHCEVAKHKEDGIITWRLKIVSGTLIFGNEHQSDQEAMTEVAPGSPLNIVTGTDANSLWMDSDGYVELPEAADCGVYLLQVQSNDRKKFINYVYVCKDADFEFPSTGRVVYGADIPPGLDLPTTDWTLQVIQIAKILYDMEKESYSVDQQVIGTQTIPAIVKPFPFQVDVINTNADLEAAPSWTLRVAKGVAISQPDMEGDCINVDWVDVIDPGCNPYTGNYDDSLWTDNAGGIEGLNNSVDYDVYLFRVITEVDGVDEYNYKLWVGESTDYDDTVCPVVLPTAIAPSGDYEAQAIHIAYVSQPTSSDVWVIEQITRGTLTWPNYGTNCAPFRVHRKSKSGSESIYEVCTGTVNNHIPVNITDTLTVQDDEEVWVWIAAPVGTGTPAEFPKASELIIGYDEVLPTDTEETAYVAIAHILAGGKIEQFVTGSLWGSRLQFGTYVQYYWARI